MVQSSGSEHPFIKKKRIFTLVSGISMTEPIFAGVRLTVRAVETFVRAAEMAFLRTAYQRVESTDAKRIRSHFQFFPA